MPGPDKARKAEPISALTLTRTVTKAKLVPQARGLTTRLTHTDSLSCLPGRSVVRELVCKIN